MNNKPMSKKTKSKQLPLRVKLLVDAAEKPIQTFYQFDCFQHVEPGDYVVVPDKDGDSLFSSTTKELRRSDIVRVHIPVSTSQGDAIRALKKIIDWIKRGSWDQGKLPQQIEPRISVKEAARVLKQASKALRKEKDWREEMAHFRVRAVRRCGEQSETVSM